MVAITSKLISIEADFPIDNDVIDEKLKSTGIEPLRWAIVKVEDNILTVSVACEEQI